MGLGFIRLLKIVKISPPTGILRISHGGVWAWRDKGHGGLVVQLTTAVVKPNWSPLSWEGQLARLALDRCRVCSASVCNKRIENFKWNMHAVWWSSSCTQFLFNDWRYRESIGYILNSTTFSYRNYCSKYEITSIPSDSHLSKNTSFTSWKKLHIDQFCTLQKVTKVTFVQFESSDSMFTIFCQLH